MSHDTFNLGKEQLIQQSFVQMDKHLQGANYTPAQKLALTCRILFDHGHDSGLAGQITTRGEQPGTYLTQRLGFGFDETCASNLLLVNEDLEVLQGDGM
ncbi:MAG: class II aldolase/adducin family protein, partial [Nitrosomonas sp.]|nr:class II aldolase/adducin family protein [Nitrosomonas sp.]